MLLFVWCGRWFCVVVRLICFILFCCWLMMCLRFLLVRFSVVSWLCS